MDFRGALLLADLGDRFVPHALAGKRRVDRFALPGGLRECQPVALIHVVRNGERVDAVGSQLIEPSPQVRGVRGVAGAERQRRHIVAAKDDIAVQVASAASRGVFVADERGELAGVVVPLGGVDDSLPRASSYLVVDEITAFGNQPPHGVEVGVPAERQPFGRRRPRKDFGFRRMIVIRTRGIE